MRVVIINCFDTYEHRVDMLYDFFINKGDKVSVVQSDFRHFDKAKQIQEKTGFIFIKSKTYYKNMSVARLVSHYMFAKKALEAATRLQPDLLYVVIPPNSLAKFAGKYKKKHSEVKLVFDLIDLWPENMPIGKIKVLPPFTFWRLMRDNSLKFADVVITECKFYQVILKNVLKGIKAETIYLARREVEIKSNPVFNKESIHLCYLGSINNVIDIASIKKLIKLIHELKPTTLHIIGDGESRNILIDEVTSTGALVNYYGREYDPQKKQEIFDKCHFGLNIMKENVSVGLTMKSIDYFQHGLPILNNIKGDTTEIVELKKIGINITDHNISEVACKIVSANEEEFAKMRESTYGVFKEMFSQQVFYDKLEKIFTNI